MPEFILRARKAPTDPDKFLGAAGRAAHVAYLAQVITNTLFISKGHRRDTDLTLVLEGSADYAKALTFSGAALGSISDQSETGLLELIAGCLQSAMKLGKEKSMQADEGIQIQSIGFERLAKARLSSLPVYLMDKKGTDIRDVPLMPESVFLLTDHIPMPPKHGKSLVRQGVKPISLGPVMLHASQCVVLIQNEFDRRG